MHPEARSSRGDRAQFQGCFVHDLRSRLVLMPTSGEVPVKGLPSLASFFSRRRLGSAIRLAAVVGLAAPLLHNIAQACSHDHVRQTLYPEGLDDEQDAADDSQDSQEPE